MRDVLILGALGFIGRNLVEKLACQGRRIHAFDKMEYPSEMLALGVIPVRIDEFSPQKIVEYIDENNIDTVFHLISGLIPSSGFFDLSREMELVVEPTRLLTYMLSSRPNVKLVYFSSGGTVYGNSDAELFREDSLCRPVNYYGFSKLLIENFIYTVASSSKLNYLIIRPSNPYGRHQRINGKQGVIAVTVGKLINGEHPEIWGDGSDIRDYIYIDDLCDAVARLVDSSSNNNIYNVGSGVGYSLSDVVNMVIKYMPDKYRKEITYIPSKKSQIKHVVLNVDKIKSEICFAPTSIDVGIKAFIDETIVLSKSIDAPKGKNGGLVDFSPERE